MLLYSRTLIYRLIKLKLSTLSKFINYLKIHKISNKKNIIC